MPNYYTEGPCIRYNDTKWTAIRKLDIKLHELSIEVCTSFRELKHTIDRLNVLEDKLEVLLRENKQHFRWVESYWELVDDE